MEKRYVWLIDSFGEIPEKCVLLKQTKKQVKIYRNIGGFKTLPIGKVYFSEHDCINECVRIAYRNLSAHSKCCHDLMEKIRRLENKL